MAQELYVIRRSMQTLRANCRWAHHDSTIADVLTKRHGNSVSMMFLRSGQFSIVDEDKEVASRRTFREEHGPNLRFHRQREGQAHRFGGIETTIRSWLRKDRYHVIRIWKPNCQWPAIGVSSKDTEAIQRHVADLGMR